MVLVSKICAAILLAAVRLFAGLIPLKVYQKLDKWGRRGDIKAAEKKTINKRRQRIDLFLSVFLCFGAGLLLSTCFIHMIPEVRDSIDKVIKSGRYPILGHFPFAEGIVVLGFFVVYLFEEIGELLMNGQTKKKQKKKDAKKAVANPAMVTSNLDDDHHKLTIVTSSSSEDKRLADEMRGRSSSENTDTRSPLGKTDATRQVVEDTEEDSDHDHHGHGHSHGPPLLDLEQRSVAAAIRGFMLVFALSFHAIFEGMAIGLQPTIKSVWFLFAAVTVHELAIMFCIGLEMLASSIRICIYVAYMVTLGLITPLGVVIGILVTLYFDDPTPSHELVIAILQGVAAGTLLYVTFLEVLERERRKPGNGLIKLLAVFLGFILLSGLEALGGHEEPVEHESHAGHIAFAYQPITTPIYPLMGSASFYRPNN